MIIIILLMLFNIFTTINTSIFPHRIHTGCTCYSPTLDEIEVYYNDAINLEFAINVKTWENLRITCNNQKGSFSDFNFTSQLPGKKINSLSIKHCLLPNVTSLKEFLQKIGIEEAKSFSFNSYILINNTFLTREHLQGISNVESLDLSFNRLEYINSDLFFDFPKLKKLDISSNFLMPAKDIFDATPNLTHLLLGKNDMVTIDPRLFYELKNLEILDLRENRLELFEDSVFSELVSLKNLNLAANRLTQLSPSSFRNLKKLERLDISFNYFFIIPSNLFTHNKALRHLFFHDSKKNLSTLPDYLFSNLIRLESVYLLKNGFLRLPEHLFSGAKSLNYINLIGNSLVTLPRNIFRGLQNLQQLLLKNNMIKALPTQIFRGLGKLRKLDLSRNLMEFIPKGLFVTLSSLKILNMERNQLKYIEQEALFPLTELKIARFSNNLLKLDHPSTNWSPFYKNTLLMELHLSKNRIENFFIDWSISKNCLRILNLSHNNITTVSMNTFYFPSNQIVVDLSYNNISNIILKDIAEVSIYQTEKRDVIVYVDHNPILCDCNLYDFIRYIHYEMPEFVYNYIEIIADGLTCVHTNGTKGPKIEELHPATYICPENEYLKIDTNCPNGCKCSIRQKDKTRIFDCSYQNMRKLFIDREKVNYFENYPLILNLTGNILTKIPSVEYLKPINVTCLLLSNNRITILELHNNQISRIDYTVLKRLISHPLKELTLSGNPLICDCNAYELIIFVQSQRKSFKDFENIKCHNSDLNMNTLMIEKLCAQKMLSN
ncbi:hypothetical protein M0802_011861 [Mischocyttarus mexicanus]|nr:hypothetical protein M0802_011861 [Mischocyttarus mexicanus]